MLTIKRYPNRKLYDTNTKKYITLEGISELIRNGQEVQVIDHVNGEDLTAVILTQIIFEQEKKQGGFLPRDVLRGLVQAGGETVGSLRRSLASPLEMFSHVDDEIRRRVSTLVKHGEMTLEEGQGMLDKLVQQSRQAMTSRMVSAEDLSQRLSDLGVPTRKELDELTAQLSSLESALDSIKGSAGSGDSVRDDSVDSNGLAEGE